MWDQFVYLLAVTSTPFWNIEQFLRNNETKDYRFWINKSMLRANCFDKKLRIQFLAEQLQQGGEENKGKFSIFFYIKLP